MQIVSGALERETLHYVGPTEAALQDSQWIIEWGVAKSRFRQQKVINRFPDNGDSVDGGMTTRKYLVPYSQNPVIKNKKI